VAGVRAGGAVRERAFAKLNLVLRVGPPGADGMHPLASLFASIDLADEVELREAPEGPDRVVCAGVEGENLAERALAAFRAALPDAELPPVVVTIHKRIPVAAGLGGGSADAAAVLRAANSLAGEPLDADALRALAAPLGSDVPSQVEPAHALVTGTGERVEPLALPPLAALLVPQRRGLSTADVYAQFDRLALGREELAPGELRELATGAPETLLAAAENDLQQATLSLRPELEDTLGALTGAGAGAALVAGSGPTCVGLFTDLGSAQMARARIRGSVVAGVRP
jgi:4-diphosphocytidyl-2-C-methyl-D-erythritol kinase